MYDVYNIKIYIIYIIYYIYMFGCLKRQIYCMVTNIHPFPSPRIGTCFGRPKGLNASEWTVENRDRFRFPIRYGSRRHWSSKPIYQSTGRRDVVLFFLKNLRCWEIIPSFPQPKASIPFICLKTHCFESWTVRNELKQFSALVSKLWNCWKPLRVFSMKWWPK